MAFEIRMLAEVRNLNPMSEDGYSLLGEDAGVLVRCDKSATITPDDGMTAAGSFVLGAAQMKALGDDVLAEVLAQLGVWERDAAAAEGA